MRTLGLLCCVTFVVYTFQCAPANTITTRVIGAPRTVFVIPGTNTPINGATPANGGAAGAGTAAAGTAGTGTAAGTGTGTGTATGTGTGTGAGAGTGAAATTAPGLVGGLLTTVGALLSTITPCPCMNTAPPTATAGVLPAPTVGAVTNCQIAVTCTGGNAVGALVGVVFNGGNLMSTPGVPPNMATLTCGGNGMWQFMNTDVTMVSCASPLGR